MAFARSWKSQLVFGLALVVVATGALAIRFPQLDERPMHGDEANQAVKAGRLLETGHYEYDPKEHHGPTLYYFTLPSLWMHGVTTLAGSEEENYRVVPLVFGIALILLLWPVAGAMGRSVALLAALFTALSPAMVYYSRYYVQEMLLVTFTFGAIVAGWHWWRSGRIRWAVATGIAVALMHATKETAVLAFASMAAGLAVTAFVRLRSREAAEGPEASTASNTSLRHRLLSLLSAALVALSVWLLFFSSFFTHARGPLDSLLTYTSYLHRAGGAGMHDKPWHYYLHLLIHSQFPRGPHWSEGLIVALALLGAVVVLLPRTRIPGDRALLRFLVVYTVVLTALYSLIPYKTPWCVLSFLHGMILLAGVGAAWAIRAARVLPLRIALAALLAAGLWNLGSQAHRASYTFAADMRNPYVYAHSVPDIRRVEERMRDLTRIAGHDLVVKVIAINGDYWPLPWYLRQSKLVGYWNGVPKDPDAAVILASPELQPDLDARLKDTYQVEYYGLRPNVLLAAYIRRDLWDAFIQTRQ